MLKQLDKWVNEFVDFACNHPALIAVTIIILAVVVGLALCVRVDSESLIEWDGDVTLEDTFFIERIDSCLND